MTLNEVDAILSGELGLLSDENERGSAKTYFLERICWHPAHNTRIARVAYEPSAKVKSIRLCVSSDNNNSVFARLPLQENELRRAIVLEIEAWRCRHIPFNMTLDTSTPCRAARR
jgi:hypothetical protein